MPKYKQSLGTIEIKTPEPAFRDYIKAELLNLKAWNPKLITKLGNTFHFISPSKGKLWTIELTKTGFKATSQEPVIYLRHGIKIFMGSSRIEIA